MLVARGLARASASCRLTGPMTHGRCGPSQTPGACARDVRADRFASTVRGVGRTASGVTKPVSSSTKRAPGSGSATGVFARDDPTPLAMPRPSSPSSRGRPIGVHGRHHREPAAHPWGPGSSSRAPGLTCRRCPTDGAARSKNGRSRRAGGRQTSPGPSRDFLMSPSHVIPSLGPAAGKHSFDELGGREGTWLLASSSWPSDVLAGRCAPLSGGGTCQVRRAMAAQRHSRSPPTTRVIPLAGVDSGCSGLCHTRSREPWMALPSISWKGRPATSRRQRAWRRQGALAASWGPRAQRSSKGLRRRWPAA